MFRLSRIQALAFAPPLCCALFLFGCTSPSNESADPDSVSSEASTATSPPGEQRGQIQGFAAFGIMGQTINLYHTTGTTICNDTPPPLATAQLNSELKYEFNQLDKSGHYCLEIDVEGIDRCDCFWEFPNPTPETCTCPYTHLQ